MVRLNDVWPQQAPCRGLYSDSAYLWRIADMIISQTSQFSAFELEVRIVR